MKVVITTWEGRVSPVFGSAHILLVANIKNRRVRERYFVPFECDSAFLRASQLDNLGAKVLICGGISASSFHMIEARNIRIIPFSTGAVDEVLDAYVRGNLYNTKFRMPGCGTKLDKNLSKEN